MQVILKEDVANLGRGGELVNVREGYGRNYLLPRGLALLATPKNVARLEHERKALAVRALKVRQDAEAMVEKLGQASVTLTRQAGEGGKLFGSVGTRDVEEALASQGLVIDRRKIVLAEPIKSLGHYTLDVKLAPEVVAKVKVWVVAKE